MKHITVEVRNVYGRETIYPVCADGKVFARMVKQSTLTRQDIEMIRQLGYNVEVQQQEGRV